MARTYRIEVDGSTGVVKVEFIGFWTVAMMDEFETALRSAFDKVQRTGKVPVLLSDLRNTAVQSADVVAAMTRLFKALAPLPRKTAILTTGQLLQFQAKRVVSETALRAFDRHDLAIAWLTEP